MKVFIVAPSYRIGKKRKDSFETAINNLRNLGFDIVIGNLVCGEGKAPTVQQKAKELIEALNSDADIVWSAGGGKGATNVVKAIVEDGLDMQKKKLFVGFSDNCSICYMLATRYDLPSIYGRNIIAMANSTPDSNDLLRLIRGETRFATYDWWNNTENDSCKPDVEAYNYSNAISGRMFGGIDENMADICGTELDKTVEYTKNNDTIMFLESCTSATRLKEMLSKLEKASWFDHVACFIVSRSYNFYNPNAMQKTNEVFKSFLLKYNKPVFLNVDISHMYPAMPIGYNRNARISYVSGRLICNYDD